jgi:hypothetical protein
MPRLGDAVDDNDRGSGKVIGRKLDVEKDEKKYLTVELKSDTDMQEWEVKFELPA